MSIRAAIRAGNALRLVGVAAMLAALLVLPACWVTSINPLYDEGNIADSHNDPDVVFDQSLIGTWTKVGDQCTTPLTITSKKEIYDLQSSEGKGEECAELDTPSHYQARLVKLDSHYFLDVFPLDDEVCGMCLAKHNIFLAKFDKATLSLTPIDSDWLKKSVEAKTVNLATLGEDTDTITASSKDLKAFCRKYADDAAVFPPDSASTFKRNAASAAAGPS